LPVLVVAGTWNIAAEQRQTKLIAKLAVLLVPPGVHGLLARLLAQHHGARGLRRRRLAVAVSRHRCWSAEPKYSYTARRWPL